MPNRFGKLLRKSRKEQGKTLNSVARHMNLSAAYICDIEKGRRGPLKQEARIRELAYFLSADPEELLLAALYDRGVITLDIRGASELRMKVVWMLRENWGAMSDYDCGRLAEMLEEAVG